MKPSYVVVRAPEVRLGTIRDTDRDEAGVGALRVCLRWLAPNLHVRGADTVIAVGQVRVRLWRGGGTRVVAGAEGGSARGECALVEAPAGSYELQVQNDLGLFPISLRRGFIDSLVVLYRVQLQSVVPTDASDRGDERR